MNHSIFNYFYKLAAFTAEEFEIPLRNKKLFIKDYLKKLSHKLNNIKDLIPNIENHHEFFKYLGIKYDIESFNYILNKIIKDLDNNSSYEFSETISASVLNLYNMVIKDASERLDIASKYLENILNELNNFSKEEIEDLAQDYNISFNYNLFFNINEIISKIIIDNKQYFILLNNLIKGNNPRSESQSFLKGVKQLYHATVNASSIMENGFKSNEIDVEGLGGSTTIKDNISGISFTSDLFVAKEIARCLKEVILISKGYINGYDILSWSSNPEEIINSNKAINGKSDLTSKKGSLDLYKIYLAYEPSRYNPFFVTHSSKMIETFKNKNEEDVGIIVASVDLSPQEYKYFDSMHEYRISPNNVISIDKIIK